MFKKILPLLITLAMTNGMSAAWADEKSPSTNFYQPNTLDLSPFVYTVQNQILMAVTLTMQKNSTRWI